MHNKYAKDGLEILTVLLDDPRDGSLRADTVKYLAKRNPPFKTVYLDEKKDFWEKKLRVYLFPRIYVFNREGFHVKNLPVLDEKGHEKEEVDYDVIDKAVANLMTKK